MILAENILWDESVLEIISKEELASLTASVMQEYKNTIPKLETSTHNNFFFCNILGNVKTKDGIKSVYVEYVWGANNICINVVKYEFFNEIPDDILDRINELQTTFAHIDAKVLEWMDRK